jgi:hypothetical protein
MQCPQATAVWQCEMRCAGSAAAQVIDACRCSHLPPSPTPMSALRAATAAANSSFGTACQPNRGPLIAACTAIFGRLMARGLVTLGCLFQAFSLESGQPNTQSSWACLRAKRGKGAPVSHTDTTTSLQSGWSACTGAIRRTTHLTRSKRLGEVHGQITLLFPESHLLHVATERTRTKHSLLSNLSPTTLLLGTASGQYARKWCFCAKPSTSTGYVCYALTVRAPLT